MSQAMMGESQAVRGFPSLIPRRVFFGNPRYSSPRLSPDGRQIAYLAPDGRDVLQVWLRGTLGGDDRVLTHDRRRGIRSFCWAYDDHHLIYEQDADGDENWHQYLVDIRTDQVRDLTPFLGVRAILVSVEPRVPGQILVGMNLEDRRRIDVYRVDLSTGAIHFEARNPGAVLAWTADADMRLRAALSAGDDGGRELLCRDQPDQDWRSLRRWAPDEECGLIGFSADGRTLHLSSNHDADTLRLLALDVAAGQWHILAEHPRHDLCATLIHPVSRAVDAAGFYADRLRWLALNPATAADLDAAGSLGAGEFRIVSRDLADTRWIVECSVDAGPTSFFLFDRTARQSTLLFHDRPELAGRRLAAMQPIELAARDGLRIHGYLTLPPGLEPRNLPAVLLVHGGPWARDTWGYRPKVQWLANRGYAVLQVNFRGSSGYGRGFLNAGNHQWGAAMQDDLVDAARWLVDRHIADPRSIAIFGGSYGGYATLAGLAFTPDLFAAGIAEVGPSNLLTLLETIPPYWKPIEPLLHHRLGHPQRDEEMLRARSPLFSAQHIRRPLLIGHGANDPRVRQAESDQIARAIRAAGRPVSYVIYRDEGHGLARPENRMHFYALAEEFLSRYLGGRCEPMGQIDNHSGQLA
jgi:dipeptidyl aminopeptidase/acylaminoacyl peptidase